MWSDGLSQEGVWSGGLSQDQGVFIVQFFFVICSQTPDIAITVPKDGLKLYQQVEITASFINPLDRRLTNASFALMGDGFVQDATVNIP